MTEYFDTFADDGSPTGLVERGEVHRRGLWHRSVYALLYRNDGRMLVQRRSDDKDLYAGCWDYAVGEHLQPGESFEAGIRRGLSEELGIRTPLVLTPLHAPVRVQNTWDGLIDREEVQGFKGCYDGGLELDPVEVAETDSWSVDQLATALREDTPPITPSFRWVIEQFVETPD